uniref:YqaJ viral recombinase domain-containing protein n=1 Tax=Cacopsylla melanoneura TaxID=428564 RepID=A0A8D8QV43_9HEMI
MFFKNKEYCSSLSMHHLIMDWMRGNPGSSDGQAFLSFCTQAMHRINLSTILKDTEGQSSSSLWHDLRYARITASKLYEASRCSTESGSLVNTILGAQKVKDTTAMERGRTLEPIVCGMVEQKYAQKVSHVGLALNEEYPMFGASPDGVMGDFVIEIKCPMSEKTFKTYFDSSMTKPSSKYLTQVMLQMLFLNKRKGLFCVALPNFEKEKKIKILEVLYDSDFMQSTLAQASQFWLKAIFPKLNKDLMPPQLLPLLDSN